MVSNFVFIFAQPKTNQKPALNSCLFLISVQKWAQNQSILLYPFFCPPLRHSYSRGNCHFEHVEKSLRCLHVVRCDIYLCISAFICGLCSFVFFVVQLIVTLSEVEGSMRCLESKNCPTRSVFPHQCAKAGAESKYSALSLLLPTASAQL